MLYLSYDSQVVVIGLVAMCSASPSLYFGGPQLYSSGYNYPSAVINPINSQYHTQNELGHYSYGYNDGHSTKTETKHPNGLTEGAYSYVDPNGVLQQYRYVSDENGYRVSGTNLPVAPAVPAVPVVPAVAAVSEVVANDVQLPQQVQDTPEVAAAKVAHQIAYEEAKKAADAAPAEADAPSSEAVVVPAAPVVPAPAVPAAPVVPMSKTTYSYHPTAYAAYPSYAYAAVPAPAPIVPSYAYAAADPSYAYSAPAVPSYAYAPSYTYGAATYSASPVHSQYHAQDEFGQYSYGYNSGTSSKSEVKTLDGVTRGGYSYVDANGLLQQYNYVSDPVNGYRVTGTNLPANC